RKETGVWSNFLRVFGNHASPGGLTVTGHRILPDRDQQDYMDIDWLRGAVMAFDFKAIEHNPYYPDVFAMGHIRCGLGVDDTFVSRWAGQHGRLLMAFNAVFHHPDQDNSRAYPDKGFGR